MSGDYTFALAACRELGLSGDEILDSVEYWRAHGAYNDEEILSWGHKNAASPLLTARL
jgi:hypothetical protein